MSNIIYSVDVEEDLHGVGQRGIKEGLLKFEKICDKHEVKPVLFVVANLIEENKRLFKRLNGKGWEISLHGLAHRRFDEMTLNEKEREIRESAGIFKKYLGIMPKGFRAPQHSIDDETLDLLEKNGFEYDSSYFPLNLMQLFFFPKKVGLWIKGFFSPMSPYKIRKKLIEIPTSSLLIPFVSLTLRAMPKWMIWIYAKLIGLFYKKPVFYAHSWDFIEMNESRVDRTWSHKKLLNKIDYLMRIGEK
jgi:hypothetical protein